MDAKSFTTFLKEILLKEAKVYENNLLSTHYETILESKRASGIRDTLVGIANSLDHLLDKFYDEGGNSKND